MTTFRGVQTVSGGSSVATTDYIEAQATLAAASAAAALVSEGLADADATATAADLVATNQDTIDTAADLVATNQDTIDTAADLVLTNADVVLAEAAKVAAEAAASASQEEVEDIAGALVATGGTKTGIAVTYDDVNGDMDFVVTNATALGNLSGTNTGDQNKANIDALGINAAQVDGLEGAALRDGSTAQAYAVSNLQFPSTQVASADANTLDDYEEGTWTPTLYGSTTAGSPTYTTQTGTYEKIGRTVIARGQTHLSDAGGMVGNIKIGGLPFTATGSRAGDVVIGFGGAMSALTAGEGVSGIVNASDVSATLYRETLTTGSNLLTSTSIGNSSNFIFTLIYRV